MQLPSPNGAPAPTTSATVTAPQTSPAASAATAPTPAAPVPDPEESELIRTLLDCGFLALSQGMQTQAQALFTRLRQLRPQSEAPLLGLALSALIRRNAPEAIRLLQEETLRIAPGSEISRAFLALAQQQAGLTHESRQTVKELLATGQDPAALELARSLQA